MQRNVSMVSWVIAAGSLLFPAAGSASIETVSQNISCGGGMIGPPMPGGRSDGKG